MASTAVVIKSYDMRGRIGMIEDEMREANFAFQLGDRATLIVRLRTARLLLDGALEVMGTLGHCLLRWSYVSAKVPARTESKSIPVPSFDPTRSGCSYGKGSFRASGCLVKTACKSLSARMHCLPKSTLERFDGYFANPLLVDTVPAAQLRLSGGGSLVRTLWKSSYFQRGADGHCCPRHEELDGEPRSANSRSERTWDRCWRSSGPSHNSYCISA